MRAARHLLLLLAVALLAIAGAVGGCAGEPATPPAEEVLATDERGLSRKELLGKRLFEDRSLSDPPGMACTSCHDPGAAFAGNEDAPGDAVAHGATDDGVGSRNAPSLLYARFAPPFGVTVEETPAEGYVLAPHGGLFWDGRASSLEQQAKVPLLSAREMGNASGADVLRKIRAGSHASLLAEVGRAGADEGAAFDAVAAAIGAYLRTPRFAPFSSRFDAWLRGEGSLSERELRGLALFEDRKKGNCVECHARTPGSRDPSGWLFTSWKYDAIGVPRNPAIAENDDPDFHDLGLCDRTDLGGKLPWQVNPTDHCGAFRVPSLRNVAVTAPYMHNGWFTSLRDVVAFYATRDTNPERWYRTAPDGTIDKFDDLPAAYRDNVNTFEIPYDREPGRAPRLDDDEVDAIVAFLETLTDE